jgi:ParB family chromosome partitioning protein
MKKKNAGLGRGLDAIFLSNAPVEDEGGENKITPLRLALIDPKSDQPRKYFDKEALEQLARSISENGVLQPILVRLIGEGGRYQIIAGERRFRAAKLAGLSEIPAIILERDDKATAKIALIENVQREDLNPLEEARGYKALQDEYGMTQEELANEVGKSRPAIANTVRLLDLPEEVLTLVASGELSAGAARTLLGLKSRDDMILLAQRAVECDLSVRVIEDEVKRLNKPKKEEVEEELPIVDYFRELELRMQSHLGRRVEIKGKGRKKTLTLTYEDNEDLDEIIALLCGKDFLDA